LAFKLRTPRLSRTILRRRLFGHCGITKQGNTYARALLIQSAWSILRTRSSTDPLKRWGDHIANTRGKRIAVVALARKLSGVLWAMLRDGTFYDNALQAQENAAA
jgi:transposase